MNLPSSFVESYLRYQSYPLHVVSKGSYGSVLHMYRDRLSKNAPKTFISLKDDYFVVPFREVVKNANGEWLITKYNALDEDRLKWKLGDTTRQDLVNPAKITGTFATQPDPRCRFIFLVSDSALAPLDLTRDALLRILAYHQVMPAYIDFLLVYGTRDEDRELRFTGFRTRTILQNPTPGHVIADLHRSGRQHEVCYNLKAAAIKESLPSQQSRRRWKIRQTAVYHRFDFGSGTALWIIGDPRETVKKTVQEALPEGLVPGQFDFGTLPGAFSASLETHLILVTWASISWRWHIQDLEEAIDEMTKPAILFDFVNPQQPEITPRAVTLVQEYEDKVHETLMVVESNIKIFSSLLTSYCTLVEDAHFPPQEQDACRSAINIFSTRIQEHIFDLQMQADRAKALSKVAADRKNIVFQQLQTQTAIKQEALASSMWEFSQNAQKETIAMRIITVITMLYLPPTFVCTFFGTDVIKYQDGGQGKVFFSIDALKSFFYVTIPLWFITIAVVYYLNKIETSHRGRRALDLVRKYPALWTSGTDSTHAMSLKSAKAAN